MDPRPVAPALKEEQNCMVLNGKFKRAYLLFWALRSHSPMQQHVIHLGQATILERRPGQAYVHYVDADKRLDEWIAEDKVQLLAPRKVPQAQAAERGSNRAEDKYSNGGASGSTGPSTRKRRRSQVFSSYLIQYVHMTVLSYPFLCSRRRR